MVCWQCGSPARADCSYHMTLVAASGNEVPDFGYPVKRAGGNDWLRLPIPRCPACRTRNRTSYFLVLGAGCLGAIVAPILQALFWPDFQTPSWMNASSEGLGTTTVIGFLVGFLLAILALFIGRRGTGLRPLNTYPLLIRMQEAGWRIPEAP